MSFVFMQFFLSNLYISNTFTFGLCCDLTMKKHICVMLGCSICLLENFNRCNIFFIGEIIAHKSLTDTTNIKKLPLPHSQYLHRQNTLLFSFIISLMLKFLFPFFFFLLILFLSFNERWAHKSSSMKPQYLFYNVVSMCDFI